MSYNGSGTFLINTAGQPVVTGTVISSTTFNTLTADLGTGLSTAITKDGQTTTTSRIPFIAGISSTLTTDSTSVGTGSIITSGGVGIAKALFVGTTATIAGAVTLNGAVAITSSSANALAVGLNGATNPAFNVDASTASSATGLNVKSAAAAGGVALSVSSSGSNEALTLNAKGTGTIGIGSVSTGAVTITPATTVTGAATLSSTLAVTGIASFAAGSAAAPAITRTGDLDTGVYFPAANTLGFSTSGVEVARIDSAGNLGIGATPSAWGSIFDVVQGQFGGCIAFQNSGASTKVGSNFYFNGTNYIYTTTNAASRYDCGDGKHAWLYAASGTAENAITFTTGMTLDASGNLGIQTAGSTYTLGSAFQLGRVFSFAQDVNSGYLGAGWFGTNSGSATYAVTGNFAVRQNFDSATGVIAWSTAAAGTAGNSVAFTERARIDASGNLTVTSAALLGYGTGAGGTVTQATNKATGVTLNKPTGQVTTNNAALAGGATVSFTVNNSLCTAADLVLVVVGNGSSYTVQLAFVGAGNFNIRITNTTGGSLSEAVQINFAIIKGAST